MKSKKHSPQQVIRKLGEAEAALASGKELAVVCQMLGVSSKTFYRWRKKYGGMKADEAKRLVALEEENKRLKKLVADLSLDNLIVKEALDIAKKL
jgi:putative transposase